VPELTPVVAVATVVDVGEMEFTFDDGDEPEEAPAQDDDDDGWLD